MCKWTKEDNVNQDVAQKQIRTAVVTRLRCPVIPLLHTSGNNYLNDVWVCILNAGKARALALEMGYALGYMHQIDWTQQSINEWQN